MCKTMKEFNEKYFPKETTFRLKLEKEVERSNICPLCGDKIIGVHRMFDTTLLFIHSRTPCKDGFFQIAACGR